MLKTVLKRELLHNLYSFRFLVSLVLLLGVFVAGALSFVRGHALALEKHRETQARFLDDLKSDAGANATKLAISRRTYTLRPRDNAFIADAKEKYLPNAVVFSAWNVFSFQNKSGSANPFLKKFDELSWSFIVALIVSFVSLMFTFDAVSWEKESKTLALCLSNPVSRGTLLVGKFLSAVVSVMAIVLVGVLVSLLLVLLLGQAGIGGALLGEVAAFLAAAGLLAAAFAALGLFSSVAAPNSNVSLLLSLSAWLGFVVIIPNSSLFLARNVFGIESSEAVQKKVETAFADLNKSAPPGSWMSNNGNPFLPQHRLRADLQRKRLEAEKAIRDDHYQAMFRQLERTRQVTAVSPVSLFEYLTEAEVGGGYLRFRQAWDDIHAYQGRFLNFFKELDAANQGSPHWFNPSEDLSTTRLKVPWETVPQFSERPVSPAGRLAAAAPYVGLMTFLTCLAFMSALVLFIRYDVR